MIIFGVVCPDRHSSAGKHGARGSSPFLLFPLRLVCTTRKSPFQCALICETHVSWGGEKEKESQMEDTSTFPSMLDPLTTNTRSLACSSKVKESLPGHTPSDLNASTRPCLLKALLRVEELPETDCFKPSKPKLYFPYTHCRLRRPSASPPTYKDPCSFPRHPYPGLLAPLAVSHSCHPMSIKLS